MNDQKTDDHDGAKRQPEKLPPAGPHAKPELTDHEKTPGTGSLPDDKNGEADIGPG